MHDTHTISRNLFSFTPINPVCVTFAKPENGEKWTKYHTTERHLSANNALFAQKVRIPYLLHDNQELKFEIYSLGDPSIPNITEPPMTFKGYATSKLRDLLKARKVSVYVPSSEERVRTPFLLTGNLHLGFQVVLPLKSRAERDKVVGIMKLGEIEVWAEELENGYEEVVLKIHGENVKGTKLFGGSKIFFEIYKSFEIPKEGSSAHEDDYLLVHRTKVRSTAYHSVRPTRSQQIFEQHNSQLDNLICPTH